MHVHLNLGLSQVYQTEMKDTHKHNNAYAKCFPSRWFCSTRQCYITVTQYSDLLSTDKSRLRNPVSQMHMQVFSHHADCEKCNQYVTLSNQINR